MPFCVFNIIRVSIYIHTDSKIENISSNSFYNTKYFITLLNIIFLGFHLLFQFQKALLDIHNNSAN